MKDFLIIALCLFAGSSYSGRAGTSRAVQHTSVGPFGADWFETWYDPGPTIQQSDVLTVLVCRSHSRLDYIRTSYFNKYGTYSVDVHWGDENAGDDDVVRDLKGDVITSITPYICTGKHKGLVCGLLFKFRDQKEDFMCGVKAGIPTTGPKDGWDFHGRTIHSLMGGLRDNKKTIVSMGWTFKDA